MEIVEIEWIDSKGVTSDWEFIDELPSLEPVLIRSVGYLWESNDDYTTLVQNISMVDKKSSRQICGRITIPAVCIKSIKSLKG